ncbi:MAG TPA: TetR/AcrR family transcriptional regulator [Candidatus Caccoplasma intestinavium]|jgi:hypothetical protein|uniref:TetR/AcrR family transcriptional regulator n=1 Tax=Candidatus Caccoplasma intestinavium TaxID=2840716 RepID=A0A9D1GFJ4_9BACT|nr:TetR/AcrR family transcriptional regulator [Barnesiella sp.]HIT39214.1 TetR/AcrR family transcriptional regulator [Candidatus Caccoplasma intestinavium]
MQISKEHIRKNILQTAQSLFYTKGYAKVPMREIASKSHVSLSNIYNYYDSKEKIFQEIVQPAIDDFNRILDEHHGRSGTDIMEMFSDDYLQNLIKEYLSLNKHRDRLFLLLFRAQGTSLEKFKDDFSDRSTAEVKRYFIRMKQKYPQINIDISDFTIHLHTVWMFTMLEELVMHRKEPQEIEKIVTEYMIFSTTGWKELIKG